MEIYLDNRAVKQVRAAIADAIEEGDIELLKEDILAACPEHEVELVEQMLGAADFTELLAEALEDWSGDDSDELLELLETVLGDHGVDLKYHATEDEEDDDANDDDDDLTEDFDAYAEPGLDDDL